MPKKPRALDDRPPALAPLWRWLLETPRLVSIAALLAVAAAALHLLFRSLAAASERYPLSSYDADGEPLPVFRFCMQSAYLLLLLLVPVLILALIRARRSGPPFLPAAIGSGIVFAIWIAEEIASQGASNLELAGVDPPPLSAVFRLGLTGVLILSPPLLVFLYTRASLLSRYILRAFLVPFAYCFLGFLAIWFIFDIMDNGKDFFDLDARPALVLQFYLVQIPEVIVLILPVTLLLAILYALGKMSKSNEIISMLTAGKSLPKVLMPIFFVGAYASLIALTLNYEWAPEAAARKESVMTTMADEQKGDFDGRFFVERAKHYRNRIDNRSWFVGRIPFDLGTEKLRNVEVHQFSADGKPLFVYLAGKADWNHLTGEWRFIGGKRYDYTDGDGGVETREFTNEIVSGWRETPWKIYSESLEAEAMGAPGLGFHLRANRDQPAKLLAPYQTERHYRWAKPWSCFIIALVAAPCGIVFSRRGMMGGVAAAMLIFVVLMVSTEFFRAMGQGMRLPAFLGAWITNFALAAVGLLLLYQRSGNRELPKLGLPKLRRAG